MNINKILFAVLLSSSFCLYTQHLHASESVSRVASISEDPVLLDLNSLLPDITHVHPWGVQISSPDNTEIIANVVFHQGVVWITSNTEHNFKLVKLPQQLALKALVIAIKGSFVALPSLNVEEQIILNVAKKTLLHNGFKTSNQENCAVLLKGGSFELRGNSATQNLDIQVESITNNGKVNADKSNWDSKTTQNSNLIEITKMLNSKGHKWINNKKGIVRVSEYFNANHVHYIDDGITEVMGLVLVNADTGRINSQFKLRNGIIKFKDNLSLSKNAKLTAENHLTLHSDKNIYFEGQAFVERQKSWPAVNYPQEIKKLLQGLSAGVIISAKQDLIKGGTIVSKNTSITYSAGGKYLGRSGASRSGFFNNNLLLSAAEMFVNDQIKSFNSIFFKGYDLTVGKQAFVSSNTMTSADLDNTFHNHGTMTSKNHILKSGYWFNNTGNIDSDANLLVDTAWHSNHSGGNITSKNATINADYAALNCLANNSAENLEINTMANLNILGCEAGTNSLTVNAPLLNANIAGLYESNNYSSSSVINLSRFGAVTRSTPSTSLTRRDAFEVGLSFANEAFANPITHALSSTYALASTAYAVGNGVVNFIYDVPDSMRLSRLAKKSCQAYKLVNSASQLQTCANNFSLELPENAQPIPLWNAAVNTATRHFGGTASINSVFDSDNGLYFTGHRIKRNVYNSDNSLSALLTSTTKTQGGEDNSILFAYRSSTTSKGDYTVSGNKSVYDTYSVRSGADVTVTKGTKINAQHVAVQAEKDATVLGIINGTEKAFIKAQHNVEVGEQSKASSKDIKIIAGNDVNIFGEVEGTDNALVKAGHDASVTQNASINGGAVVVVSENDAVIEGTVNATNIAAAKSEFIDIKSTAKIAAPQTALDSVVTNLEPGYSIEGKELEIKGEINGLGDDNATIANLMTQTGLFEGLHITDRLALKTEDPVTFTTSCASASKSFDLEAYSITLEPNVAVSAPEVLKLDAAERTILFKAGSSAKADVFLDISAAKDVYAEYATQPIPRKGDPKLGYEGHTFSGVTLTGGTGLRYTYTDPDSGETKERLVGLRVRAGNEVKGTAMAMSSQGDILVSGTKGVTNAGLALLFTGIHYRNDGRKVWENTGTSFFSGSYSTPAKLVIESVEGGYNQGAGKILVGQGADICTNDTIDFYTLKGKQSRKENSSEVEDITLAVNLGDSTVRFHSCKGEVNAKGLCYYGPQGTLSIKGVNILLDRDILQNKFSTSGWIPSFDYSLFSQWKSFEALQASKDFMNAMNIGNYVRGAVEALNPSLSLGIDHVNTSVKYQTVGNGSVVTKNLVLNADNTLKQNNAFAIQVLGDADVKARVFLQQGAQLHSQTIYKSGGLYLRISLTGISIGVRTDISKTSAVQWIPAVLQIDGIVNFDVGNMQQIAATAAAKQATGNIDKLSSETKQDTSRTTNFSASAGVGVNWAGAVAPEVGFNAGVKASRQSHHTSGLTVGEGSTLGVGGADLKGAQLNGVQAETTRYRSLPSEYRDRGAQVGLNLTFGKNPTAVASVGVSNNGHELGVSINLLNNSKQQENKQLFESIGNISYANKDKGISLSVPIITKVNTEAFKEFADDTKGVANKIANAFTPKHELPESEQQQPAEIATFEQHFEEPEGVFQERDTLAVQESSEPESSENTVVEEHNETQAVVTGEQVLAIALGGIIEKGLPLELEVLSTPIEFAFAGTEPQKFGFRIKGTNIWLQSADQFNEVVAAVEHLKNSPSPFASRGLEGVKKSSLYFYHSELTPYGNAGNCLLKSKVIVVATENSGADVLTITGHEGNHIGIKGDAQVPGNPEELLAAFGEDLGNHLKNPSAQQGTPVGNMFDGPWAYFEITFKEGIAELKLTEPERIALLRQCRESIIKGKTPTFDSHPHASVLNQAAKNATNEMLGEVAPFMAEASIKSRQGLEATKKAAPNTFAYLEEVHTSNRWYQNPAVKNAAIGGMLFGDFLLHIWQERAQGRPMPEAIAEGTIRTVTDNVVNIPVYTGITLLFGGPIAWTVAISQVAAGLVPPEELAQKIEEKYTSAHEIMSQGGNPIYNILAAEDALDHADLLGSVQNMQAFNQVLHKVSECINDAFDRAFPEVKPAIAQAARDILEHRQQPDRDERPTWMMGAP